MRYLSTTPLLIIASLSLALGACDKKSEATSAADGAEAPKIAPAAAAPKVATEAAHAPPGAKPGSHADWCGGHQVPESLCTRCNPSLTAAFKATGDWCAEHGLPESQCLACNPDLKIERPPKTGATP
jgi:hypothetical protein